MWLTASWQTLNPTNTHPLRGQNGLSFAVPHPGPYVCTVGFVISTSAAFPNQATLPVAVDNTVLQENVPVVAPLAGVFTVKVSTLPEEQDGTERHCTCVEPSQASSPTCPVGQVLEMAEFGFVGGKNCTGLACAQGATESVVSTSPSSIIFMVDENFTILPSESFEIPTNSMPRTKLPPLPSKSLRLSMHPCR